ncbi:MAG: SNARE associated Golgi protein, partial [Rhodospirillales bacterium]|nr:SNARE associated Golgi protein [Rhodospirillales bacterium]
SMTLLIRLLPAGSNFLTNLAAGVSSARFPLFLAGSAIGYIPQMVVFALLGSGINLDPGLRISASVVLFFVSAGLGIYLFRRVRHGHTFDRAVDEAVEADETRAEDKPAA